MSPRRGGSDVPGHPTARQPPSRAASKGWSRQGWEVPGAAPKPGTAQWVWGSARRCFPSVCLRLASQQQLLAWALPAPRFCVCSLPPMGCHGPPSRAPLALGLGPTRTPAARCPCLWLFVYRDRSRYGYRSCVSGAPRACRGPGAGGRCKKCRVLSSGFRVPNKAFLWVLVILARLSLQLCPPPQAPQAAAAVGGGCAQGDSSDPSWSPLRAALCPVGCSLPPRGCPTTSSPAPMSDAAAGCHVRLCRSKSPLQHQASGTETNKYCNK